MWYLDYTLPRSSKYLLFLDAPFRYSWRHLIQYFNARIIFKQTGLETLTKNERMFHFSLAFLEVLPIFGMVVALLDRLIFYKKKHTVGQYTSKDAKPLSFMLQKIVPIYIKIFGDNAQKEAMAQEAYILPRYKEEMKQIAYITGTHYNDILLANTILDRLALFGGSILVKKQDTQKCATSYFHSQGRDKSVTDVAKSFWRFDMLEQASSNPRGALLKVNMQETISSCIYEGKNQCLYYAFGSDYSAARPYRYFKIPFQIQDNTTVAHNIDFPMGLLAPFTRLFLYEKTAHTFAFVSVGWLGLLGTYFGINEHGLALSACSVPKAAGGSSQIGTPNHLLFRQILEEAKTTDEAAKLVKKVKAASSMNLIIADCSGLLRIELGRK